MIYADLEFFLKEGGGGERGSAFHDYFCSPFGPERRGCITKTNPILVKFSDAWGLIFVTET